MGKTSTPLLHQLMHEISLLQRKINSQAAVRKYSESILFQEVLKNPRNTSFLHLRKVTICVMDRNGTIHFLNLLIYYFELYLIWPY